MTPTAGPSCSCVGLKSKAGDVGRDDMTKVQTLGPVFTLLPNIANSKQRRFAITTTQMDFSERFTACQAPVPSPDGLHIASISSSRIHIRSTTSLSVFRSINLPSGLSDRNQTLRWVRTSPAQPWCYRFLIFDADNVRVWDLRDAKWTAVINNGSGGMGKIVNAEFGFDMDDVLVTSDFGSKITSWSLVSGRSVEIRDPKFASTRGCRFRPAREGAARAMALLSRPAAQDIVTLHAPKSYNVMRTINLSTHDAQGLKWSADGRWFAVWDAASVGTRAHVYTADGHLYRIYSGELGNDQDLKLGMKSLEWSLSGDYLAVGGYDRRVVVLSARTLSPKVYLEHTPTVQISEGHVWQESVSAATKREYTAVAQPTTAPLAAAPSSSGDITKAGISILAFNVDGTLLATRDDAAPTVVWIWDMASLRSRTILLQHSPVQKLSWHSSRPDLLLIQCVHEQPIIYLWSALSDSPMVLCAPIQHSAGRIETCWLPTKQEQKPAVMVFTSNNSTVVWPDGRDLIEEPQDNEIEEEEEEVDQSLDSVVEMLAGRTPLPAQADATLFGDTQVDIDDDYSTGSFEDTFRGKRPLGVA